MATSRRELQELIFQLIETLHQELHQHRRLLDIVRRKKFQPLEGEFGRADVLLALEKEVLGDLVTMQRDRISLVTELGQLIGHSRPPCLRIAEIVLHSNPEGRDELLELRDELRDIADEFEALSGVEPNFTRHRYGQIRLYLDPESRSEVHANLEAAGASSRNPTHSGGSIATGGEGA